MDLFVGLFRHHMFEELGASVIGLGLVMVRILAFMHFAPIFSHKSVPAHARIGMTILLTAMFADRAFATKIPEEGFSLLFLIMTNFTMGFVMGFMANILFTIMVAGGEMMDASMGFSSAQMFDPSLGSQTTIFGRFMSMLSVVVFFSVGGPEMLLQGLSNSFESFSIFNSTLSLNIPKIIHLTGDIIRMGFVIVSPIVLTILVNDLILGLLSRASPQINAFQISFTIKPVLGILILTLILPMFFSTVANIFTSASRLY